MHIFNTPAFSRSHRNENTNLGNSPVLDNVKPKLSGTELVKTTPVGVQPLTPQDYANAALSEDISLPSNVGIPSGVRDLYAGAQACMTYAGFWHPFSGVAVDLLGRAIEAAVIARIQQFGSKGGSFKANIDTLKHLELISESQQQLLHEVRRYRNARTHAKEQEYLGIAGLDFFRLYRKQIIEIFADPA
ncbi:DUF4145 domain-containing protein [Deinococcus xinjiangensis]|uniref:DUF4145 domain-containing protein n=1 Tax=Deinococcus xinjiangensis TaxID=457454 RepID=UPI003365662C